MQMDNRPIVEDLVEMIKTMANSEEEIQEILDELQQTDWASHTHELVKCRHCRQKVQRRQLREDPGFIPELQHFCTLCEADLRARATERCTRCGRLFEKTGVRDDPCPFCAYWDQRVRSARGQRKQRR